MTALDESVTNLQRFLGQLAQATEALEQVGAHIQESAQRFGQMEDQAADDGGGLNDELEELETALESGRNEVRDALSELGQAADEGQQGADEARDRVERAATDLEALVDDALEDLGEAHSSLTDQGFQPLLQMLDEAESELQSQSGETRQASDALEAAIHESETESQTAWDAVDAALDAGIAALAQGETSLEAEASDGVQGFTTAADELESACTNLVGEVDTIYDVLDASVAQQGQEWDQTVQSATGDAADFVTSAADEQVTQPSRMVEDEALETLGKEYGDLGLVLASGSVVGQEAQPLGEELTKCGAVIGQVDELMNALAG